MVLDSLACKCEDHLVTCRDESVITAVGLAALHHLLAVDALRWFADFAMEKHWHSSDAVYQQLQGLIQIWYTAGTYDQSNLGSVAAVEELARQIESSVDAWNDRDNVRSSDSRFYTGSRRAGDALVPSMRRHVARQIKEFRETEPAQRRFRGRAWWNSGGSGKRKECRWRERCPATGETTSLLAAVRVCQSTVSTALLRFHSVIADFTPRTVSHVDTLHEGISNVKSLQGVYFAQGSA